MIELLEKKVGEFRLLDVKEKENIKTSLIDYLDTYARQYNEMVDTFAWIQDKLSYDQKRAWQDTIRSLEVICRALDTGFDPIVPPKNWSSGQLIQYIAPIPENVRKQIDLAEPIFSRQQILIYDPNPEHFRRPKVRDPMAIGFVNLTDQRIHFLIGSWNLAEDLKFIEFPKERKSNPVNKSVTNINELMKELRVAKEEWDAQPVDPYIYQGIILPTTINPIYVSGTASDRTYGTTSILSSVNDLSKDQMNTGYSTVANKTWINKMFS